MTQTFAVPYVPPLDWASLMAWLSVRALPGVEMVDDDAYTTAVTLPGGPAVARMTNDAPNALVAVEVLMADGRDADECDIEAARRLTALTLDLDADPGVIDAALADVPVIGPLVEQAPGMRIPGEQTPLLALVRALAGQQVSVAGGLAQMYRLVEACRLERPGQGAEDLGAPASARASRRARSGAAQGPAGRVAGEGSAQPSPFLDVSGLSAPARMPLLQSFPDADTILAAGFDWYRGPAARRESIRQAVEFAAAGGLDVSRETEAIGADLLALRGIGPWTVAYTLMRGYGDADVDLTGDRALVNAARALSDAPLVDILDAARPFRSYAALHLWRSAGS